MLRPLLFSTVAALAVGPTAVLAWGGTGHAVICEIAFQALDAPVREKVKDLIRLDDEYTRFSAACNYPDRPRKRAKEHYVNLSRGAEHLDSPCPVADKCVTTAIMRDISELALSTNVHRKLEALKFVGHWVGDVHQPLHVAFRDDRGGNDIKEQGPCRGNLHAVWDTCILEKRLGTDAESIAHRLRSDITPQQRAEWTAAEISIGTVMSWANESFKITIAEDVEYCMQKQGACWYQSHNKRLDVDEEEKVVTVEDAYINRHIVTIERRLTMAGVRLAQVLNEALSE